MQLELGPHLEGAELERYSMHALDEAQVALFEEHLLACTKCQDRLLEMDAYINAVRSVSPRLRAESEVNSWLPRLSGLLSRRRMIWVVSVASLVVTAGTWQVWISPSPVAVALVAARGEEFAQAPARRLLILKIDLTELPVSARYQLTLVDSSGDVRWRDTRSSQGVHLEALMPQRLGKGRYFVRLYSPTDELLREFGLQLE